MTSVVILPSPLLPAMAYRPLADTLRSAGHAAEVADVGKATDAPTIIDGWRAKAAGADVVVAHSNAGLMAPLVAGDRALVFVDAALPPTQGSFPLANERHRSMLDELVDRKGRLPQWTRWWPRSAFEEIVPDKLFGKLDRACPQLPLSYFDQSLTVPDGWVEGRNAYLAFGVAYTDEFQAAGEWGWPRKAMQGAHLHLMVRPDDVAREIIALADALG